MMTNNTTAHLPDNHLLSQRWPFRSLYRNATKRKIDHATGKHSPVRAQDTRGTGRGLAFMPTAFSTFSTRSKSFFQLVAPQ